MPPPFAWEIEPPSSSALYLDTKNSHSAAALDVEKSRSSHFPTCSLTGEGRKCAQSPHIEYSRRCASRCAAAISERSNWDWYGFSSVRSWSSGSTAPIAIPEIRDPPALRPKHNIFDSARSGLFTPRARKLSFDDAL